MVKNYENFLRKRCHIAELLNSADCLGLTITRAHLELGVNTVLHIVREAGEIYFILSCQGNMEIGGNTIGTMHPGDLVRVPADTPRRIANTGSEDPDFWRFARRGLRRGSGGRWEKGNDSL